MSDDAAAVVTIEDVRNVAQWAGGHPVLGPVSRAAIVWWEQAQRNYEAARQWRAEAERLGWTPGTELYAMRRHIEATTIEDTP